MINSENTPKLQYSPDLRGIIIHKKLEGEEGRDIESQ